MGEAAVSQRAGGALFVGGLAVLLTALNALKPVHVDDSTYLAFARQIARHPLDPYGFALLYFNTPLPAHRVLAPPVFCYWFGAGVFLFGEQPVVWKLWLLPFALTLVAAVWRLARRFAPGLERPLTLMTVMSPTVLPGFNLMTDVPCVALSLTAIALFISACDCRLWGRAAIAGLVAGLAMQTKYTGFLAPAAMLAYAILNRGFARWLVTTAVAALLFASWEGFVLWRYGESHFQFHLHNQAGQVAGRVNLLNPLGILVLQTAPAALLLFAAVLLRAGVRALRPSGRDGWFLVLWVVLELAGYFALTPYAAVRRVMGLSVALTLLGGNLAVRAGPALRNPVRFVAALGVLLGLLYYGVDLQEARAEEEIVEKAADWIRQRDPEAHIWYMGYWGFQYYAERAGMKQVIPGLGGEEFTGAAPSEMRAGDWLVFPEKEIPQQLIVLDAQEVEPVHRVEVRDGLPFRTLPGYYNGGTSPLRWADGPRCAAVIARVRRNFVPVAH